ncbi:MliC family protein [Luteimonas sp. Y-2-2-4F]|nr:MliC family protein [Luteimonas sp. Y-2-2-4F]MCD9030135.1 MliC family protein [Luteimonas sp. Y-2-2-4F]
MKTTLSRLLPLAALALALSACADRPGADPAADPAATPPVEDALPPPAATAPPGEVARDQPAAGTASTWACADVTVDVAYDPVADTYTLSHPGGTLTLHSQVSGSGARYADDAGNEFWDSGDEALLTLAGQPQRNCVKR